MRDGLLALVDDSDTALGRVASALRAHDAAHAAEAFADESESKTDPHDDVSTWPTTLRIGATGSCSRTETVGTKRVEQLLHWVPYSSRGPQLQLARNELGLAPRTSRSTRRMTRTRFGPAHRRRSTSTGGT